MFLAMKQVSAKLQKVSRKFTPSIAYLPVESIMQKNPVTIKQTETIDAAAGLLSEYNIRHLPVIDDNGDIQGVISDRDLLGVYLNLSPGTIQRHAESNWNHNQVSTIMSKIPETVDSDTTLGEAGTILIENQISCLPIVEGNKLVGIITDTDFVKVVSKGVKK